MVSGISRAGVSSSGRIEFSKGWASQCIESGGGSPKLKELNVKPRGKTQPVDSFGVLSLTTARSARPKTK